jgi:hypothetical protein
MTRNTGLRYDINIKLIMLGKVCQFDAKTQGRNQIKLGQ